MDVVQYARNGMHKDNDISAQPKDTYRDALNGNLITGDGKFFAFTSAKGNKFSFEAPTTSTIIIGWAESKDYLYLFATTNETDSGGYGEILKVSINEVTNVGIPQLLYSSNDLNFTTKHPIGQETVYIEESSDIGRIYWTDNFNPPRVINVLDPNVSTIDVALLNVTPGLLPSEIDFGGTIKDKNGATISGKLESGMYRYTYRLISSTTGAQTNWFPLTNPVTVGPSKTTLFPQSYSNYLYYIRYEGGTQGTSGAANGSTTKGTKFFIKDLDIKYDQIQVGAFFYNGFDTNPNGIIIKSDGFTGATYEFEHVGNEFLGTVTPGDVEITTADIAKVKTVTTNKNRLMFGNITESAEIDYKDIAEDITHQNFIYTYLSDDTGLIGNGVSSLNGGSTLSDGITQGLYGSGNSPCGFYGHPAVMGHGIDSGDPTQPNQVVNGGGIRPGQWYGVANSSSSVQYPPGGNTYATGDYFMGKVGDTDYKIITGTGNTPVKAYVRVKKFKSQNGTDIYNNVNIPYEFLDNKGVFNNYYTQGYWRGETYRYALIVWDKYMRPSFAEFIDDVKMPEIYEDADIGDSYLGSNYNKSAKLSFYHPQNASSRPPQPTQILRNLGIQFNNIQLGKIATQLGITESELPEYISGFSIVRAPTDESIVAQGLLTPIATTGTVVAATNSLFKDRYFPFNWPATNIVSTTHRFGPDGNQNFTNETKKHGKFLSPEMLFDLYDRWDAGAGSTKVIDDNFFTHIKILGRVKGIGIGPSSSAGNTNMVVNYGGDGGYVVSYTRFLESNYATPNWSGTDISLKSIRPFNPSETAFTFDPESPSKEFINLLYYSKSWASTALEESSPAKCNYGSRGAILNLDTALPKLIPRPNATDPIPTDPYNFGYAYYVNIIDKKSSPYGGTSDSAKSNTNYISTGHFQPINADVYAKNGNSWTFDEVQVFGGDCYVNLFDVTSEIFNPNNVSGTAPNERADMASWTDVFPVESRVNTGMRRGRHANKDGIMAGSFLGGAFILSNSSSGGVPGGGGVNSDGIAYNTPEAFVYNEAYSQMTSNVFYPATPFNFKAKQAFPNRVRYSLQKIANEPVDNFRQFLLNNLRDVDIQNRGITNLRVRGENLFYWQERAVGYLPINERVTVATSLGEPTEIGIGGVMTRYDERTDFYGNQHKHGLIETPDGFIWIDRQNRALLNMNLGGQVAELSAMKGMMSFLDSLIKNATLDNPIDKDTNGFTGIYDARTKNTYITFVGRNSGTVEGTVILIDSGKTILNLGPSASLIPYLSLLSSQSDGSEVIVTYNGTEYQSTIFGSIGQFLSADILVSINSVIPGLATGDIASLTFYADIDSQTISFNHLNSQFISRYSFKPCMYARFNALMLSVPNNAQGSRKEMYIHEEGDIGRFYKSVYDTDITLIVNPSIEMPKVFDNIETNIGPNGPSSIEYSTSFQSATDIDIENNSEYKFRNRDWMGTVARDEEARMRDHYMKVKLIKDNKLNGSATTSSNKEIKFLSLKTILRPTY